LSVHHTSDGGVLARQRVRRRELATLTLPDHRDPVGLIEAQHATRIPDLVPVRVGRMLQSPFAFYRGTAALMAADLKDVPTSGFDVVACGDAHIANFGFYASPERNLVFDLNDFDEAAIAPWEWDLRRLAASVHIAGRDIGLTEPQCRDAAHDAVESYRATLEQAMRMSATERFFARIDDTAVAEHFGKAGRKTLGTTTAKALTRTSEQVLRKLTTHTEHGELKIVDQPPVLRHVPHPEGHHPDQLFAAYRRTVREDVAVLLGQFRIVDFALRVVGVGSVGTRCYLIALQNQHGDALFLQAKEAQTSVLVSHGGRVERVPGYGGGTVATQGHRVVAAQRVLQASSDPFLGWITGWVDRNNSGQEVLADFYWRQFRDMKGSIEISALDAEQLRRYSALCAGVLARAHAQSPAVAAIQAYMGGSDQVAEAMSTWAAAYADVAEADYDALARAVDQGRLPVERGV